MAALRFATRAKLPPSLRSEALHASRRNASTSWTRPTNPLRTGLYATLFAVSTGLMAVYYFDSRSSIHRYVLTPLVRNLFDAEIGHKLAVKTLRTGLGPRDTQTDDEVLTTEVRRISLSRMIQRHAHLTQLWPGLRTSNPVGVAAGFDKDGEAIDGKFPYSRRFDLEPSYLPGLFNLGFSWVEIGSVTPKPQVNF